MRHAILVAILRCELAIRVMARADPIYYIIFTQYCNVWKQRNFSMYGYMKIQLCAVVNRAT